MTIRVHPAQRAQILQEIVEVTITAGGFPPDSIKSLSTINAAVADGRASLQRTGKVINCPIVDERTAVTPSPRYASSADGMRASTC